MSGVWRGAAAAKRQAEDVTPAGALQRQTMDGQRKCVSKISWGGGTQREMIRDNAKNTLPLRSKRGRSQSGGDIKNNGSKDGNIVMTVARIMII